MAKVDSVLGVEMGRNATEESRQNVICQSTRLCQNYTWKNLMLSVLHQLECLRLDEASKLEHELLPCHVQVFRQVASYRILEFSVNPSPEFCMLT